MMFLMLIRLIMIVLVVIALVYLVRTIYGILKGTTGPSRPSFFARSKECPVCRHNIKTDEAEFNCPSCSSELLQTSDGKIRVKIN
jgi:ribosomal protein S27E